MGCSVVAKCECGYESPLLMIGGGMLSFGTECKFPAYCAEGDHLVTVNLLEHPCPCSDGHKKEPTPYNNADLKGTAGENEVVSWRFGENQAVLTDGTYFCPACHQYMLKFSQGGMMWD